MNIDELFDETLRLEDVLELSDRLVWMWRMTSYRVRCETGTCHFSDETPDQTELIINFRDALIRDIGHIVDHAAVQQFAELLAVQTMKRADAITPKPPEHLWKASEETDANCVCGWHHPSDNIESAFAIWEEHSSDSLELQPWQEQWLNKFNV